MTEWKTYILEAVCSRLSSGKGISAKLISDSGLFPVYGGNGIRGYTSSPNFSGDCAIVGRQGAYCGNVRYFKGEAYMTEHAVVVCANSENNTRYLAYLLSTMNLGRLSGQSAQPGLSVKTLGKQEIVLPPKDTQNKVAELLGSLDEKISNNNEINQNLYEILRLSFIHDYLEECQKHPEWIELTLDDITDKFATGLNPRKNFVLGHGTNYYVTIKNMLNNRIYLNDKCDKVDDEALVKINNRSDLRPGDLLFSGIGTIGRTYLISKPATNWNISESVFTIRPSSRITSEFLYLLLLSSEMQDYAISNSSGSVQKGIRMADLKNYRLICPPQDYVELLTGKWRPMIDLIKRNEDESDSLAMLRDTLLPKLMSGELDVTEVEL